MSLQCQATTKRGSQCKNPALTDSSYCSVHAHGDTSETEVAHELPPRGRSRVEVAEPEPIQSMPDPPGNEAFSSNPADPFESIAAAMQQAAEDEGLNEKSAGSPEVARRGVAKAAYATAYCLGFGAAFPACLVLNLLPSDGAVACGLRDGVADAANRLKKK